MLHQYEPNVKATIKFLRLLKLKVNASTVNETLQNHPDWPSLLCISDSLNKWNIPNGAGKIDVAKINELPTPFIAYTNNSENPLAIVTGVAPTTVTLFQKKYTTLSIIAKDEFLKTWNGIYLIAEPNEHSGETNYVRQKRKLILYSMGPVLAISTLIIFSIILLNQIADRFTVFKNHFLLAIFYFISRHYRHLSFTLV